MAIDFADIDFIKDAADDIRKMTSRPEFYEKVVKIAADIQIESAQEATFRQQDPSGNPFEPLSPSYAKFKQEQVGNQNPNLRYRQRSIDRMKIREKGQNRGAQIYFEGRDPEGKINSSEYMYKHQTGQGRPKRKIFPEAQDMNSSRQMGNHEKVYNVLGRYLNQPRRINIVG